MSDSPDTAISANCIHMTNALTTSATWTTETHTLTDTPRMLDSSHSYHPRKTYIGNPSLGSTDHSLCPTHCLTSGPQETFARCSSKGKELSENKIMRSSQGLYYLICLRLSWDSWIKCKPLFIIHELLSLSQGEMWTILYFILRGWSLSTLSIMSGKNGIMNYVYNEV